MLKNDKKINTNTVVTSQPGALITVGGLLHCINDELITRLSCTTPSSTSIKVKQLSNVSRSVSQCKKSNGAVSNSSHTVQLHRGYQVRPYSMCDRIEHVRQTIV